MFRSSAASKLEMCPRRPRNAFLEPFWTGEVGKHVGIVVAFQQHGIQGCDHVGQAREDVAQVGQDAQPVLAVIDHEHHTVRTVMGRANSFHRHLAELDRFPGNKIPKVTDFAQCKSLGRLEGLGGGVDRQAELADSGFPCCGSGRYGRGKSEPHRPHLYPGHAGRAALGHHWH